MWCRTNITKISSVDKSNKIVKIPAICGVSWVNDSDSNQVNGIDYRQIYQQTHKCEKLLGVTTIQRFEFQLQEMWIVIEIGTYFVNACDQFGAGHSQSDSRKFWKWIPVGMRNKMEVVRSDSIQCLDELNENDSSLFEWNQFPSVSNLIISRWRRRLVNYHALIRFSAVLCILIGIDRNDLPLYVVHASCAINFIKTELTPPPEENCSPLTLKSCRSDRMWFIFSADRNKKLRCG